MKLKDALAFTALGLIWGSSFLWIKIAVTEIPPFTLVAFRISFGALGMYALCRFAGEKIYFDRKILPYALIMGLFNAAVPYTLISWGETRITSASAGILNGTVPLFTVLLSHFLLHDEKISSKKVVGLITGFAGMFLLVAKKSDSAQEIANPLGEIAVIVASIFYAYTTVYAKRHPLKGTPPLLKAFWLLFAGAICQWIFALAFEAPLHLPKLPKTWFALVWLGLLGSCTAYRLYLYLIASIGSTRTTLVTYVMPVVGLSLGLIFLGEAVTAQMVAGMILVISGIVIVNVRLLRNRAKSSC